MEAEKRVSDINWSWAVAQINQVVNEAMTQIEKDDTLNAYDKNKRLNEIEKAWQRILSG
jgi:HEAT repeat protein